MDNYDVAKIVKKHLAAEFNGKEQDFDSYKIVVTELKENGNKAMKAAEILVMFFILLKTPFNL